MLAFLIELQKKIKKWFKEQDEKITDIKGYVESISTKIDNISRKEEENMAEVRTRFDAVVAALDAATNEVAAEIAELRASLGDKLTEEDVTKLTALEERLKGLASDPVDPVPGTEIPVSEEPPTDGSAVV